LIARTLPAALVAMSLTFSVPGFAARTASTTGASLTALEAADLTFMREEEKLARDTYLTLGETWTLAVFANIASSEQRHMDAILALLTKYRLPDPATSTLIGEFNNPELQALYDALISKGMQSDLEALMVGGIIEETDMEDIQAAIDRSQHPDVVAVFENLMCGSRNHLRAFAANIEAFTGQPYAAQVLAQTAVDEILSSPLENCGE
jgi:hypothetical protein